MIAASLKGTNNLKVLKLMKAKIGDEGAIKIFNVMEFTGYVVMV